MNGLPTNNNYFTDKKRNNILRDGWEIGIRTVIGVQDIVSIELFCLFLKEWITLLTLGKLFSTKT